MSPEAIAENFFDAGFRIPSAYHEWANYGSPFAFLDIPDWPRWMRRLFVLTLPLACVLWLVTFIATALCVMALWVVIVIGFGGVLALLLCGFGIATGLAAGCRSLWS